ncbi:pyridoxamine 5'-phosphate oxidase family protein [Rhodoferax sp.]|uniref:pyridoxamine 5'-phosphate oxidase family protein n=1 Tax=Rhodoferax sp. TaxID=50421 RepID=UPI001A04B4CA|nr:pyridoxamine 5'-phosphate oxidase family protein [Rhodoferax sp.]MBE0473549.1 pyridoxamine 5'-phosphate oxidase family protein [Rhodoferax sp.]
MRHPVTNKHTVQQLLDATGFAILATEGAGQPHASLIAITPFQGWRQLLFATYRDTLKYRNLQHNPKVSVLADGCKASRGGEREGFVVTAVGQAHDISADQHAAALQAHLKRHPDLAVFLQSPDCVLVAVAVQAYQVVRSIDDVTWWTVDDLNKP